MNGGAEEWSPGEGGQTLVEAAPQAMYQAMPAPPMMHPGAAGAQYGQDAAAYGDAAGFVPPQMQHPGMVHPGMMPVDPNGFMMQQGPGDWMGDQGEFNGEDSGQPLSGRIVDLAFSKNGSMALQAGLVSTMVDEQTGVLSTITDNEQVSKILLELEGCMDKVMQDRYGSHLARALVKVCTVQQRISMWRSLQGPTLIGTACSHFGKWVVQRMIESAAAESAMTTVSGGHPGGPEAAALSKEEMGTLQQALCNNHPDGVLSLCFDPNGSTVMKACVVSMPVSFLFTCSTLPFAETVRLLTCGCVHSLRSASSSTMLRQVPSCGLPRTSTAAAPFTAASKPATTARRCSLAWRSAATRGRWRRMRTATTSFRM